MSSNNYLQWSFASPTIQTRFTNDFLNVGSVVTDTLQRARQSYLENRVQTRQQPQAHRLFNLLREKPHVCGLFLSSHETLGWRKQLCYNTLLSVLYTDRSPELTVQQSANKTAKHTSLQCYPHTHTCMLSNELINELMLFVKFKRLQTVYLHFQSCLIWYFCRLINHY